MYNFKKYIIIQYQFIPKFYTFKINTNKKNVFILKLAFGLVKIRETFDNFLITTFIKYKVKYKIA